jgi:D-alanine-D-alanine ligase
MGQDTGGEPARSDIQRLDRTLEGLLDLRSGSDLTGALRALGHEARPLAVDCDLDVCLRQSDIDACLLALHGRQGGSGDVQALLTVRGIPFMGPGATAVGLAFDKIRSRQVLAYHNLPVPAAVALGRTTRASERALALLGWPCMVKPRRGAGGLGVAQLTSAEGLTDTLHRALDVDDEILLERTMVGTEVQVVLLGERVLGSAEICQRASPEGTGGEMICPPRTSRGRLDGIHNLARRAVAALGLEEGLSRVDVLVGDRTNEVILEVEPLPPLHREGVVARVARAAGLAYEELVSELVDRIMLRVAETTTRAEPRLLQ